MKHGGTACQDTLIRAAKEKGHAAIAKEKNVRNENTAGKQH